MVAIGLIANLAWAQEAVTQLRVEPSLREAVPLASPAVFNEYSRTSALRDHVQKQLTALVRDESANRNDRADAMCRLVRMRAEAGPSCLLNHLLFRPASTQQNDESEHYPAAVGLRELGGEIYPWVWARMSRKCSHEYLELLALTCYEIEGRDIALFRAEQQMSDPENNKELADNLKEFHKLLAQSDFENAENGIGPKNGWVARNHVGTRSPPKAFADHDRLMLKLEEIESGLIAVVNDPSANVGHRCQAISMLAQLNSLRGIAPTLEHLLLRQGEVTREDGLSTFAAAATLCSFGSEIYPVVWTAMMHPRSDDWLYLLAYTCCITEDQELALLRVERQLKNAEITDQQKDNLTRFHKFLAETDFKDPRNWPRRARPSLRGNPRRVRAS